MNSGDFRLKKHKIYFRSHKKSSKEIKKRKNAFFFFKFCCILQIGWIDLPVKKWNDGKLLSSFSASAQPHTARIQQESVWIWPKQSGTETYG